MAATLKILTQNHRFLNRSTKKIFNRAILKLCIVALVLLRFSCLQAQTFSTKGEKLYDYFGSYFRQKIEIEVFGLPEKTDSSFGLELVCLTLHHERVSDLKITLETPLGSSIWLTNRNGKDTGKHYINTCFKQFGKDGFIHRAAAPFTGEFTPDGQMEFLNGAGNPNGTWKLFIEDLQRGYSGVLDSISLTFGNKPAYLITPKKCDFENIGLCDCEKGKKNCELLPDLVIIPAFTKNQVEEYAFDDSIYSGQLRFAATIGNIGYGPMEVVGTKEWVCGNKRVDSGTICKDGIEVRQRVKQRIYSKDGDKLTSKLVDAGTMYLDSHPGHNHYHVDSWVEFRLVKEKGKKKTIIAKGRKVSYCLFTTGICYEKDGICNIDGKEYNQNMPNYGLGNYSSCNTDKQGITVGGYDTYGMMYEGQYLNLPKGLKNGDYWLEIEVDPEKKYIESNKLNNTLRMKLTISKQQK